jgi:hypothetical protein
MGCADEGAVDQHTGHLRFDIGPGRKARRRHGLLLVVRPFGDSVVGARKTETFGSAAKLTAVNAVQVLRPSV